MGMIMKDGIPYGGIYPIDDAPTQGSNNAVKSGGVHSALSNKVDKVAGKGLSTNDYDDTEKGKVADNTAAIEAIVNVTGCCNVFDIDNPISLSNVRVAYNGIINTDIDTKTVFNCWVATFDSSGQQIQGIFNQNIDSTGHKVLDVTIPDNNYYSLQLRHNGSIRDLAINVPAVPAGDYKLSFDVVGYNPSTVGGLAIRNIMLYDARLNPTGYVSYAMTNRELTESTLKYVKVSKSSFTWDTSTLTFQCPNPPSEVVKNKGFVIKPLNGMAIMGGYYSTISGYLFVFGWIPSNAQSVDDEYDFDCYILI